MKNISVFLLIVALSLGVIVTGCNKDFLQKPKGGSVTVDTIFHTKKQAQYAVAQMYNDCIRSYIPYGYWSCRPEVITDEIYILHPTYDWAALAVNGGDYITGNMTPSSSCDYQFSDPANGDHLAFNDHYAGIRQANLVLQDIHMVQDANEDWKKDVKGQALFCRAMQHFELFRYYGGIPIVTIPLNGEDPIKIPRSSVATVVDSVVSWCNQAIKLLPANRSDVDFGKVTKLAARALKARILLYAASPLYNTPTDMENLVSGARYGDKRDSVLCYLNYDKNRWKIAADAAKDVIDYAPAAGVALYNTGQPVSIDWTSNANIGDYAAVWNIYANKEIILASTDTPVKAGSSFNNTDWGQYLSSKLYIGDWAVKNNIPLEFLEQYEKRDGTTWTMPQAGEDLPTYIEGLKLDPRFYQTIAYDGMHYNSSKGVLDYYRGGDGYSDGSLSSSDAGVDGYAFETYKFIGRVGNGSEDHIIWPVFRLAEFYLSYAEALNEYQGPSGDPTAYLNKIRERAGMPDKYPSDPNSFRKAVHHERTIEFAYEGLRYNDLLRWLEAGTVLNETLHGVRTTAHKGGNGQLERNWKVVTFIKRVFPQKYYYVPFPNDEVSKNYLGDGESWNGQNPGW